MEQYYSLSKLIIFCEKIQSSEIEIRLDMTTGKLMA